MEITISQAHNVLRTYDHLIKSKPDRTGRVEKKGGTPTKKDASSFDKVTISNRSREQLKENENLAQNDLLSPIDEE